jgi:hypothetical protein
MIQPIVSFVVLGSIIVHGLSIPLYSLGRGVRSRTPALGVTLPDWVLFYARRPENNTDASTATGTDVECGMESPAKIMNPAVPVEEEVVTVISKG